MNLASTIARLKSEVAALQIVGSAFEVAAALEALAASPAAFVIEQEDKAGENQIADDVHQRVAVSVQVLLAVRNARDSRGESGQDDLETLRLAVRDALLGWAPDAGIEPLTYASGHLYRFNPGLVWWIESFRTAQYIRSTQ